MIVSGGMLVSPADSHRGERVRKLWPEFVTVTSICVAHMHKSVESKKKLWVTVRVASACFCGLDTIHSLNLLKFFMDL